MRISVIGTGYLGYARGLHDSTRARSTNYVSGNGAPDVTRAGPGSHQRGVAGEGEIGDRAR